MSGLTNHQVTLQQKKYGSNKLVLSSDNLLKDILTRLWRPSSWILEFLFIIELFFKQYGLSFFILLLLLITAMIGAWQEEKIRRRLHLIATKLECQVLAMRNGEWTPVLSSQLVPEDIIQIHNGDLLPADVRILRGNLETNEISISGEDDKVYHQKGDEILAGVKIIQGSAEAQVIRTGINSMLGKTIHLINLKKDKDPFIKLINQIMKYLALINLGLLFILYVIALLRHQRLIPLLPLTFILLLSIFPFSMPLSLNIIGSIEAKKLMHKDVFVSELDAMQVAANLDILMLDKTGTLTDDKFIITKVHNFSNYSDLELFTIASAATNRQKPNSLELAFQSAANITTVDNHLPFKVIKFINFDGRKKYSSAQIIMNQKSVRIKLGDPFRIVNPTVWYKQVKPLNKKLVALTIDDHLVALFEIQSQLYKRVPEIIHELKPYNIRPIIITGDDIVGTQELINQLNLSGEILSMGDLDAIDRFDNVIGICNVLPEDKLTILNLFKNKGYMVGMVGDGINDAPTLKHADLGIATQNAVNLAKSSAKVILNKKGLNGIIDLLKSGYCVHRSIISWIIFKLSWTLQLTTFLTLGYLIVNFIPMNLYEIILLTILNSMILIFFGIDNNKFYLNNSSIRKIQYIIWPVFFFVIIWNLIGLFMLYVLHLLSWFGFAQIQNIFFVFFVFSTIMTFLMIRARRLSTFYHLNKFLFIVITIGIILTALISLLGLGIVSRINIITFIIIILFVILTAYIINYLKIQFFSHID